MKYDWVEVVEHIQNKNFILGWGSICWAAAMDITVTACVFVSDQIQILFSDVFF